MTPGWSLMSGGGRFTYVGVELGVLLMPDLAPLNSKYEYEKHVDD